MIPHNSFSEFYAEQVQSTGYNYNNSRRLFYNSPHRPVGREASITSKRSPAMPQPTAFSADALFQELYQFFNQVPEHRPMNV